jgi:hypothetical protein
MRQEQRRGRFRRRDLAMSASGVVSNKPHSHASDAPPRLRRRGMERQAHMRRKDQRALGRVHVLEITPGISLVPERYIASPSARTPTPNIDAQASISPVATGTGPSAPGSVALARDRPDRAAPAGAQHRRGSGRRGR